MVTLDTYFAAKDEEKQARNSLLAIADRLAALEEAALPAWCAPQRGDGLHRV